MEDEELASAAAAAYLGVSRTRITELTQAGRIGHKVAGKYWVYTKSELDAYRAQAAKNKGGRPPKTDSLPTPQPNILSGRPVAN